MSIKMYNIAEFKGIDQSRSENGMNPSYSPDACNMNTENGDLAVAKGFVKHRSTAVPFSPPPVFHDKIRGVYVWRTRYLERYLVTTQERVYAINHSGEWESIVYYGDAMSGDEWDFLEVTIDGEEYLIIANGEYQLRKWSGSGSAQIFGSGETVYTGTVSAYASKVVTVSGEISAIAETRLYQAGIIINGTSHKVEAVNVAAKTVTLAVAPTTAPTEGQTVRVRGGLSDASVNYLAMHYGRLFAAGSSNNPTRLYWSQTPGDNRSIEDWTADDASENTGGGFVDVGAMNDPIVGLCSLTNQLLIFKRDSLYRLLGDRPSNYRVYQVNAEVERMTNDSVVLYGDTPMWLTKAGIYYFDGQTARPMGNARQIRAFLDGADLSMCKGQENRDKLYFTAREGESEYDNAIVVYDVFNKTYMVRRGFNVAGLCSYGGTLYMANDARYVYRMEEGDTYDGAPINAYWKTPLSDLNGKYEDKTLVKMYMRGTSENDAPLLLESRAGKHTMTSRILLPENEYEVADIPLRNQGRTAAFKFSNEAGGHWTIKGGVQVEFSVTGR